MRTTLGTVAVGIGIGLILMAGCTGTAPTPTAMFRVNPRHTGVYDTKGVSQFSELKWKFKTEGLVWSSPAIADSVVYVVSRDGHLHAVDARTGQEQWEFETSGELFAPSKIYGGVWSSPAIADGVVYFGIDDGHLYAVDLNTGLEKWKFKTGTGVLGGFSSPAIGDGVVYVGNNDGNLYAVDINTGQEKWKFKTEGHVHSSPAIADRVVYFGSHSPVSAYLYAVNINTGRESGSSEAGPFHPPQPSPMGLFITGAMTEISTQWTSTPGRKSGSSRQGSWGSLPQPSTMAWSISAAMTGTSMPCSESRLRKVNHGRSRPPPRRWRASTGAASCGRIAILAERERVGVAD